MILLCITHTPVLTAGYFFVCLIISLIVFFVVCFSEIEALEACKWLRAAGFPQYAQMYEGEQHFNYQVYSGCRLFNTILDSMWPFSIISNTC